LRHAAHAAQDLSAAQIILAVFPVGEDRTMLESIFGQSDWQLQFVWSFQEAQAVLQSLPVAAVMSQSLFPDGYTWKDLLTELQSRIHPPPLIVADRLADEALWAEVLNLGGYDLLMKPFDTREVLRIVSLACRCNSTTRPPNLRQSGMASLPAVTARSLRSPCFPG
jgi:DNA-binding response OmpR family regulator